MKCDIFHIPALSWRYATTLAEGRPRMKGTAHDAARRESPGWPDGAGAVIRPSAAFGRTLHRPAPDFLAVAAQTAARRAEHAAVEGPGARLTYAEVAGLSDQLAHGLVALGVGRDQSVGIS